MISMTDKEFIIKFDIGIDLSADEILDICNGDIGIADAIRESPNGQFTRTFQVEGRWFRAYWAEPLFERGTIFRVSEV